MRAPKSPPNPAAVTVSTTQSFEKARFKLTGYAAFLKPQSEPFAIKSKTVNFQKLISSSPDRCPNLPKSPEASFC